MRNERNDQWPADLLEGEDTREQARIRRKAALAVAARAKDSEDCALLLDMLGLGRGDDRGCEVA